MEITTREYIEQLTEGVQGFIHIDYDECWDEYTIEFEYDGEIVIFPDITEDECLTIAKVIYKVMNK